MEPLRCCMTCKEFDHKNIKFKNQLRCMFCDDYTIESIQTLYEQQKTEKGCSTCKNCKHVIDHPGFVTAEECQCIVGLKCDTVLFTVKNCPKWIGLYEKDIDDLTVDFLKRFEDIRRIWN